MKKRKEFYEERLKFWDGAKMLASRDVLAAEAAGVKWDPEESGLPKRIGTVQKADGGLYAQSADEHGWLIATTFQGDGRQGHPGTAWTKATVVAMVDAYNRLQAGELVEKDACGNETGEWRKVPLLDKAGSFIALPPGIRVGSPACDAFILSVKHSMGLQQRINEAMEYLDPKDTVYRILNGEEP